MRRRTALAVAVAYLAVALAVLGDYGPTWDCCFGDYRYGEAIWRSYLGQGDPVALYDGALDGDPAAVRTAGDARRAPTGLFDRRTPHPAFLANFSWAQLFPAAAALSAASCDLLWSGLGLVGPLRAHHLVLPLLAALLLYVLTRFHGRGRRSPLAIALPALLLASSPRFFAHACNNLKDLPEACFYSVSALAFCLALRRPHRTAPWLAAGIAAALALAQKQNGLLLGPQLVLTALAVLALGRRTPARRRGLARGSVLLVAATGLGYVLASPWLWFDPARLTEHWTTALAAGVGSRGISLHGIVRVLTTTPLPLLAFALVGVVYGRIGRHRRIVLGIWLAVVLGRLLLPGLRNFNGVRHFLEFYPPLVVFAAAGIDRLAATLGRALAPSHPRALHAALATLALLPGLATTVRTHPHGVCAFNSAIGGLDGARRAGFDDAHDYWGNSYWQALGWLRRNAEPGGEVLAPTMQLILAAGAPLRLGDDLSLWHDDNEPLTAPFYVVLLHGTRESDTFQTMLDRQPGTVEPTWRIEVQGAPILSILAAETPEQLAPIAAAWHEFLRAEDLTMFVLWSQRAPVERVRTVERLLAHVTADTADDVTARIRELLPAHMAGLVERMVTATVAAKTPR